MRIGLLQVNPGSRRWAAAAAAAARETEKDDGRRHAKKGKGTMSDGVRARKGNAAVDDGEVL